MRSLLGTRIAAGALLAFSAPAPTQAQNTSTAAPPAVAPPPATTTAPPPATTTAPPVDNTAATPPAENTATTSTTPAAAPPNPVTIDPDAAYPNGFADPVDPFANDAAMAQRDQRGFPWGLFGLLGLLGLIPLFRRGGKTRTVYVDRNDPKRVLREEVDD